MQLRVQGSSAFQLLSVTLDPGEGFVSEAGKMVRKSVSVDTDITTRSKGKGGVLSAFKRLIGGDSFFLATYHADGPGEVVLAPDLVGEVKVIDLDGAGSWMCAGGSYMASGRDVQLETRFQGLRGLFSGESMFFVEASGRGPLVVNAFGSLREILINGDYVVDTGHVVAFESTLEYEVTKAGKSWLQSFLAGEGFVMKFKGRGRLWFQSHNPRAFGKFVGPKLPPR